MAAILHIETATKVCSVALSNDGQLIDFKEETSDKYIHAERLTVLIQEIMNKNNLSFNDLAAVSVASGPGSYTGLRIGVSTAKGICYALDIPLISVGALDAIIDLARLSHPNQSICAMIDARRMEVFSKIVDANNKVLKDVSADELNFDSYAEFKPFVACGDAAEKCTEIWNSSNVFLETKIASSARGQVALAYHKLQSESFENLAYFEPFYLKDFVATKSKKRVF